MNQDLKTQLSIFKGKKIRKTIHQNEWYFSVIDVVEALTESSNPQKKKFSCLQLKLESSDGKKYKTDFANTEGIFLIIQ